MKKIKKIVFLETQRKYLDQEIEKIFEIMQSDVSNSHHLSGIYLKKIKEIYQINIEEEGK